MDLEKLLLASPFHRWLGLQMVKITETEVHIRLPYKKEFAGSDEEVNIHGGVISSLIDISACFAMMNSAKRDAPNLNLEVHYTRMAAAGDELTAYAKTIKAGRTLGIADVEVRNQDDKLIAVGRSLLSTTAPERKILTKK